uniref:Uncharacterized protein n=1 Tax=Vespula pensylvanica TaxID=30213 RepID=A0A834NWL7_VESPE|nr:hypothetical protein H0235_010113 [Vespula pensylvanica]
MTGHRGNSVGPTNHGARPINSWRYRAVTCPCSISWKSAAVRRKHPDWMGLLCPKGKTSVRKEERGRRWEEKVE